jgi:phosphoribosylamine--glycine ligase
MKVLVVGSGGREHTIIWKLKQNPRIEKLYCAPGNSGIAQLAECVPIGALDISGMTAFAKENAIDLVVVAPDDPLAAGMVDALEQAGIRAFGPRKNAAIIEASKAFSKDLMKIQYSYAAYETLRTSMLH